MREILYLALIIAGSVSGWFLNEWLKDDGFENVHISLEQATKQSRFNLVRDDFAEYFYLCEEKGLSINHWKALLLTGYRFQYGIDAKDLSLKMVSAKGATPEVWDIEVKDVRVLSSELRAMKAFTLDKAWFKNQENRISTSKDELVSRKISLAAQRMYGDPNKKIYNLLKQSIQETIINLSKALGKTILIRSVKLPAAPDEWRKDLNLSITYQCGDALPVFDEDGTPHGSRYLGRIELPSAGLEKLEVIELPVRQ